MIVYDYDTYTLAEQLAQANAIERNSAEVNLIYPEPYGTDSAWKIQAALDAIGTGRGSILLASGDWTINSDLDIDGPLFFWAAGNGLATRLYLGEGVRGWVQHGRNDAYTTLWLQDMAIIDGDSAVTTVDTPAEDALVSVQNRYSGLWMLNQAVAGFHFQNGVYSSSTRDCRVVGDETHTPQYGILADTRSGIHNTTFDRCDFRELGIGVYCDGTGGVYNMRHVHFADCLFESNFGPVADLTNCWGVGWSGEASWWEKNCRTVEASPVPVARFTDCKQISVRDIMHDNTGQGCWDTSDGGKPLVVVTNNRAGHVYHGAPMGKVDFGQDGHAVFCDDRDNPIHMDCARQLVQGPDGQWYVITPGQVVNLEPVI